MRVGLLGTLALWDADGGAIDVAGRQRRVVLAILAASPNRVVATDTVVDAIWGDEPPDTAVGTLQSHVSRLRRLLPSGVSLAWAGVGYRLDVAADDVDAVRFERLADEGRTALDDGRMEAALDALTRAEALWRGRALEEFDDVELARSAAVRLDERRLLATEDRMRCELALGHEASVVATLAELCRAHPLRERFHELYATALYRSGRQADALRALGRARRTLADELGLDPGRSLRDLEQAILAQDPLLDGPADTRPARDTPVDASPDTGSDTPLDTSGEDVADALRTDSLVGRERELAQLAAAFDESAGDSRFVVIEGEPGIGKTRLADELAAVAARSGALVVWGRSDESGAAPALWPWLEPLRAIASRVGDVPTALAETLAGDASTPTRQADAAQFELFEAVARLLGAAGGTGRTVILLDDLQWADAASLALLGALATRLEPGVLIVATMRPLDIGRRDAATEALAAVARRAGSRRIVLRGLLPTATATLIERTAPEAISADVAAAITMRAEGNPFYAIELARLLGGDRAGTVGNEVPGTVADVIRRRLARLPDTTAELLATAAVIGRDVDVELLSSADGRSVDAVLDALDTALVHRLLVEPDDMPGRLRFSHALVREVLLDDLTALRRARLHLAIADAIEQRGIGPDNVEILAEHLYRAIPAAPARRAADVLEQAAAVAITRVAFQSAEELLTRAVALRRAAGSTPADQEAELVATHRLFEVGRALRYFSSATSPDEMARAKSLALTCGREDLLSELLWFECATYATAARVAEAEPLARDFMERSLASPEPDVQASGHETYGVWCWGAGRIAEAVEHLDRAVELLEQAPPPNSGLGAELRTVTRSFWFYNHAVHGDVAPDHVFGVAEEMLAEETDRFHIVSICGFAGSTSITLGAWHRLEQFSRIGLAADESGTFRFWYGQLLIHRALTWMRAGRIDEGLALFTEGRDIYTGVGGYSGIPMVEAAVAECLLDQGAIAEAVPFVEQARADVERLGERWGETLVTTVEAMLAAARGAPDDARRRFDDARRLARAQGAFALVGRVDAAEARTFATTPSD